MRYFSILIISIFILSTITGCANKKQLQETNRIIDKTILDEVSTTPSINSTTINLPALALADGSINLTLDEYQLCDLTINSTEIQIVDVLGKPKNALDYYLFSGSAWAELRCLMEYDGIRIRTGKQLKTTVDDEDGEYLLSEIDVFTPDYTTYSGIKVGDSMDDVTKAYKDIPIITFNAANPSFEGNMIYNMLTRKNRPKLNGDDGYQADFDYGQFDKFAYIYYFDEDNPSLRTSLIFLFHNETVTHIILYNWLYEVV